MYINDLLNALISASGISKSEFAQKTDYAPSAISKMLTQRKFPSEKATRVFLDTAAKIFSSCVWKEKKLHKIDRIFYYTYDFKNEREVYFFLKSALQISYYKTMRESIMDDSNKDRYNFSWDGVSILNQVCIRLSFLLSHEKEDVDLYSTLDPTREFHLHIWNRMKYNGKEGDPKVRLHQLVSKQVVKSLDLVDTFQMADIVMKCFDVYLWEVEKLPKYEVSYIPNHLLATYNFILPDVPQVYFVEELSYVLSLKDMILGDFNHCITYDQRVMEEYLANVSYEEIDRQLEGEKFLFSFITMGYFLTKEKLMQQYHREEAVDKLIYLFNKLFNPDLTLFSSPQSIYKFFETGEMNYPVVGQVHMSAAEMLDYMESYADDYVQGNRMMVIKEAIEYSCCLINAQGMYLYTRKNMLNGEKMNILRHNLMDMVRQEKRPTIYEISDETWRDVIVKNVERDLRIYAKTNG